MEFDLPVQLATRLVLDSISYSSPLPPWSEPLTLNYERREDTLRKKISTYLTGGKPSAPFRIDVPKKGGEKKTWVIPSVNDQIVLQACVSALAAKLSRVCDQTHVVSYRYSTEPAKIQLTDSQVSLWREFQDETARRKAGTHLLQIDIDDTFQSIDRSRFFAFLDDLASNSVAVRLLRIILEALSEKDTGLPLVNDSIFFLGNAYLRVVDDAVRKYTDNFIRFVDDYRIFSDSRDELESLLDQITREVAGLGFKLNNAKVKLGTTEDYLEALAHGKYAVTEDEHGYVSAAAFEDIAAPDLLLRLIDHALSDPEAILTEGFGRLSMGSLRRIRLNHALATIQNYPHSPLEKFQDLIQSDPLLIGRALDSLERYLRSPDETWRAVWLIYFMRDVFPGDDVLKRRTVDLLDSAASRGAADLKALWAKKILGGEFGSEPDHDVWHDENYLDAGLHFYGYKHS